MSRKLFLLLTLSTLTLNACGKTPEEVKKIDAASALAESTCAIFDPNGDGMTPDEAAQKYAFKDAQELDAYIDSIQTKLEADTLRSEVAIQLNTLCGSDLATVNLTAEDMAKEIVGEVK